MPKHKKSKHEACGKKNRKKLRKGRIEAVEHIGGQFLLINILAKACRGANWQPGMKIKIDVGDGQTRSYTPIAIDAESGESAVPRLHSRRQSRLAMGAGACCWR